tara:strand:- start:840 stop:2111 length:1272 start_codon:yes stop_codon:yes gene_type:complete
MANTKVQSEQIEDGAITADKIADGAIVATELADNAVTTAKINADAVTGAKIADDAINSEHYTDGSIDTAHIADSQITVAKMAANSVDSDQFVDGSIDTVHIADSQVTTAKIADGNISTAKIADDAVTEDKLANAINTSIAAKLPLAGGTVTGDITMGGMILNPSADGGRIGLNRNPSSGAHIGDSSLRRFQVNGPDSTGGDYLQIQSYNSSGTHQGNFTFQDGNLTFGDDQHLYLGDTTADFDIYHIGGSVSVVRSTPALVLQSDDYISLGTYSDGEIMLKATKNGSTDLYYDNAKVLETITDGIKLTGGSTSGQEYITFNNGSLSLADGATYTLTSVLNTGALISIGQNRSSSGVTYDHCLLFAETGTAFTTLSDPSGRFAINSATTDGKTNIFVNGANVVIQNEVGTTVTYSVAAFVFQGN